MGRPSEMRGFEEYLLRDEPMGELDNLEQFRGVREDSEPFARRRPGRPRKATTELTKGFGRKRRPRGRKKMIRERLSLMALKQRLATPRLPKGTPPPIPRPEEPVPDELEDSEEHTDTRPVLVPKPTDDEPELSLVPPHVDRSLRPPNDARWDTYSEKLSRSLFSSQADVERARVTLKLYEEDRPRTRADCLTAIELANDEEWLRDNPGKKPIDGKNSARPCPWVSCRYHLAINVTPCGSLQVIKDWDDGRPTCSLDVIDANGPAILDTTGKFFGLTRERLRQIEVKALMRAKRCDIEFEDPPDRRSNEAF